jgi:hypothetical protein
MTTEQAQAAGLTPVAEPDATADANPLADLFAYNNAKVTGKLLSFASKVTLRDTKQPFDILKGELKKNQPKFNKQGEYVDEFHFKIRYLRNGDKVEETMSLSHTIGKDGKPTAGTAMRQAICKAATPSNPVKNVYISGGGANDGYRLSTEKPV